MDGNKMFIIFIVAMVALGGVTYYFQNSLGLTFFTKSPVSSTTPISITSAPASTPVKSTSTATTPVVKPAVKQPAATSAKIVGIGSYKALIALKQPLICTVKSITGYKRSGTMYIAGNKMRANFIGTSMIDDGAFLYAWINGATKGIKLTATSSVSGSSIATNGGIDPATDISYACNPWKEDQSVFAPPTSVTFAASLYS